MCRSFRIPPAGVGGGAVAEQRSDAVALLRRQRREGIDKDPHVLFEGGSTEIAPSSREPRIVWSVVTFDRPDNGRGAAANR